MLVPVVRTFAYPQMIAVGRVICVAVPGRNVPIETEEMRLTLTRGRRTNAKKETDLISIARGDSRDQSFTATLKCAWDMPLREHRAANVCVCIHRAVDVDTLCTARSEFEKGRIPCARTKKLQYFRPNEQLASKRLKYKKNERGINRCKGKRIK